MKEGDIIVCVEPKWTSLLTLNKHYVVVNLYSNDEISIIQDNGEIGYYSEIRFKLLSEYRENKLNDLGI